MKRIVMLLSVGMACLLAGTQLSYGGIWHISDGTPGEDPYTPPICKDEFEISAKGNVTCDSASRGMVSNAKTVNHKSGEETPTSDSVTLTAIDCTPVDVPVTIVYDTGCSAGSCGNGGDASHRVTSVNTKFYLGRRSDGKSAGYLWLYTNSPSPFLSSPRGLQLFGAGIDTEKIIDISETGMLRQVMAPQCFVDLIVVNAFQYDTKFYLPNDVESELDTNGYYVVKSGRQPFTVWRIGNPSDSTNDTSTLDIIQTLGGDSSTNRYQWEQDTNGVTAWGLTTGGGLRIESLNTVSGESGKVETRTIKNNAEVVAFKERKTYSELSNGKMELVEQVVDPNGSALTTSIGYYENEAQTGKYGNIYMTVNSDGSWTRNDYNTGGLLSEKRSGWLNAATNAGANEARSVAYEYAPFYYTLSTNEVVTNGVTNLVVMTNWIDNGTTDPGTPRVETESILGNIVSKIYRAIYLDTTGDKVEIEEKCVNPDAESGYETNLRTVRVYNPKNESSLAVSERIKRIDHPDGRRDSYSYEYGMFTTNADPAQCSFSVNATGEYVRVTCVHGTSDSSDGIANKTTKEVTIEDYVGRIVMQETYAYVGSSYTRIAWVVNYLDSFGRPTSIYKSNGTHTEATWGCCGKEWEKDENGVEYSYTYDALKRVTQKVKSGISAGEYPAQADQYTTYTYDAEGRMLTEVVSASSLSLGRTNQYDMAGRMTNSSDFAGLKTITSYSQDGLTATETLPGGYTRITERHKDGQVKSITGTAQISQYYAYGVNENGTKYTTVYSVSNNSPVWVKTTTDLCGRTMKIERPGDGGIEVSESFYNTKGQLVKTTTTGKSDTLYAYDEMGNQIQSGLDVNSNGELDLAGLDRISESDTSYELVSGVWYLTSVSKLYATDNSVDVITNSVSRQRLTGFTGTLVSETLSIDAYGNQTVSQTTVDRSNKKVSQTVNVPNSTGDNISISVNGLLVSSQSSTLSAPTLYTYDALGRRTTVTDARLGNSVTHYDSHGWVDYVEAAAGKRTSFTYDSATGRKISQTDPLTNTTYYAYTAYGQLEKTWGSASYPVLYEYNGYGRMTEMNTYRGGSGWSSSIWPASPGTADTTEWIYHEASGLLTSKKDAAGKSVSYTYSSGGKLASRTWARVNGTNSLVTSYSYNDAGDLSAIDYSDGTPDVSFTYDRLGRQKTADSDVSSHTFAYNGLLLDTETIISSAGTNVIDRSYDSYGRSTGFGLGSDYQVAYGYDGLGRFSSVSYTNSSYSSSVSYSYLQNSDLISIIANGDLQTTRTYEQNRNLLTQIKNEADASTLSQFDYVNDAGGRRTSVKQSGSAFETGLAFNKYNYNNRSEVISGDRYWGSDLGDLSHPVEGQAYGYVYDNIGNRSQTEINGETATYAANNLNQYGQRTIPDSVDILGSATTGSTVTVNNESVSRYGKYFHKTLQATNASFAEYKPINVTGIYNPSGTNDPDIISTSSGHVFIAKTPELFTYDDDGNLLSDGRFNFTWDAENRLTSAETLTNLPASVPRVKVEFAYDYMSRRVSKTVSNWNSSSNEYQVSSINAFVYDGWNLIQEITDTPSLNYTNTYIWGLDLSGSLQGAGGIGGLLAAQLGTNSVVYSYDGNGNVSELISDSGAVVGHYEYSPFGETIVATGALADDNPFRFSTKYYVVQLAMGDWGRRWYIFSLGRWASEDLIGINGGVNLYGYVGNDSLDFVDVDGQDRYPTQSITVGEPNPNPYGESKDGGNRYYPGPLGGQNDPPPVVFPPKICRSDCKPPNEWKRRQNAPTVTVNGCSAPILGDNPSGYASFTDACNNHDRCYADCKKGKAGCDRQLYKDARAACAEARLGREEWAHCVEAAELYYYGVKTLGQTFYDAAQDQQCECVCPPKK